jgi:WD40 repeat protein
MRYEKMVVTAVVYLSSSRSGKMLAAGYDDGTVAMWNLETGKNEFEFKSKFDFGGERLSYSESKSILVAGAYQRYGIACHNTLTGERLWHRNDLKGVQNITLSPEQNVVYCCFDDRPCQVLNLIDGSTRKKLRAVRSVFVSPGGEYKLYHGMKLHVCGIDDEPVFTVQTESWVPLEAILDKDIVAFSEVDASVRIYSLRDGAEIFRYKPPDGTHIILMSTIFNDKTFYAVLHNYKKREPDQLIKISPQNQSYATIGDIGEALEKEFCLKGTHLITGNGCMYDCSTANQVKTIPFPEMEIKAPVID